MTRLVPVAAAEVRRAAHFAVLVLRPAVAVERPQGPRDAVRLSLTALMAAEPVAEPQAAFSRPIPLAWESVWSVHPPPEEPPEASGAK